MNLDNVQRSLIDAAASAVSDAWREQWTMIEEQESTLAAEYLMTTAVARALAERKPGCVRIERLIGRAFRNRRMRDRCKTPVPAELSQGRIDIVVAEDGSHITPYCLVELKRKRDLPGILKDANRIARLISHTGPKLPEIFGFCLFPLNVSPKPTNPPDYTAPRDIEFDRVRELVSGLQKTHQRLAINELQFPEVSVERASVVSEVYDDGTEDFLWDSGGFRMEPVAIVIQKRQSKSG